nr:MAG TPA: hypothetical protein [Caudoviricetes sp.]
MAAMRTLYEVGARSDFLFCERMFLICGVIVDFCFQNAGQFGCKLFRFSLGSFQRIAAVGTDSGLVADLTVTFRAGDESHFLFSFPFFAGFSMCAVRTKKGKRAHVRRVVVFAERGRGARVSMGRRLFGSIPEVGFAVSRPLAVHSVDGLFVVFAVDDGLQRFSTGGSFCVVVGGGKVLGVQKCLGAGIFCVQGVHVILRLGTDTHAAAVLAVEAGIKFQFPIYQISAGGFDLPQARNGVDFCLPFLFGAEAGFTLRQQGGDDLRLCGFDGGKSRFVGAVHNQISGGLAVFVNFQGDSVSPDQLLRVHVCAPPRKYSAFSRSVCSSSVRVLSIMSAICCWVL